MTDTSTKSASIGLFPPLFDEFDKHTPQDWRSAVEASLKGASYEKVMAGKRPDGLAVPPYTFEPGRDYGAPGEYPFVRGDRGHSDAPAWEICQELRNPRPSDLVRLMKETTEGLSGVVLRLDRASRAGLDPDQARLSDVGKGGVCVSGLSDMRCALAAMAPMTASVHLDVGASGLPMVAFFAAALEDAGVPLESLRGSVRCDPLGELASSGMLPRSLRVLFDEMATLLTWSRECAPQLATVGVSTLPYHNAGASLVQELGLGIATAIEYARQMISRGHNASDVLSQVQLELGVGTDVFAEVARLRAARLLWSLVAKTWGEEQHGVPLAIHARTCGLCLSSLDEHTNILRATVGAFAAAIGGATSVCVAPYDEVTRTASTELARRIARGVQLLLDRESRVEAVLDPCGGSRYVEMLTEQIAAAAWDFVQKIEAKGGVYECLEEGFVQSLLEKQAAARLGALASQKAVLVGVNQFADPDDCGALCDRERDVAASELAASSQARREAVRGAARADILGLLADVASSAGPDAVETVMAAARCGATLGQISRALSHGGEPVRVDPLVMDRPAREFENLRRRSHAYAVRAGRRPTVFLACVGPASQYKARADFSRGFFEVGGFDVLTGPAAVDGAQAGVVAARSGADIAVLCSTDETYPNLVPAFVENLRRAAPQTVAILAGYPKDQIEAHRGSGIDLFIHLRADLLATLGGLLDRMGA